MKKAIVCFLSVTVFLLSACNQPKAAATGGLSSVSLSQETETTTPSDTETGILESETFLLAESVIASHKEEYAQALYTLIISLPEVKPESTLKQKDVDCDTLQWFNATYSMFTYHSGADYHLIGGYSDEAGTVDSYVSNGLEQSWGITDRATAIESIAWLASDGHAPQYVEEIQFMDSLGLLTCDEYELRTFFAEVAKAQGWTSEESGNTMNYYIDLKNTYDACGENGIDAWDYCRIMQLCGSCYYAGFLTLEESLSIQLATARVIQSQFDSWDAMNTSYLKGYGYWAYGSSSVSARAWAYQKLTYEEDCPFTVLDFNMSLEKFW